jgi:hypothetical protein
MTEIQAAVGVAQGAVVHCKHQTKRQPRPIQTQSSHKPQVGAFESLAPPNSEHRDPIARVAMTLRLAQAVVVPCANERAAGAPSPVLSMEATLPPVLVFADDIEYCEVLVLPCDSGSNGAKVLTFSFTVSLIDAGSWHTVLNLNLK